MTESLKTEGEFTYAEAGEGRPLIVLHGLMGALSNFDKTFQYFSDKGYKVLIPELPLYTLPLLKTNVKNLANFLHEFIEFKGLKNVTLLGNSLGGHIALYFTKNYPKYVHSLVLTGSSGLYEKAMGDSYPKRGSYEYIEQKTRDVFYAPAIATKELEEQLKLIKLRITMIENQETKIKESIEQVQQEMLAELKTEETDREN